MCVCKLCTLRFDLRVIIFPLILKYHCRIGGALTLLRRRGYRTAFSFLAWGTSFSALDCGYSGFRKVEDIWNPIMAGASVGALFAIRRGPKQMMIVRNPHCCCLF